MSRGPDAATRLERALIRAAAAAGIDAAVIAADSTRWASATFTGARHQLRLSAPHSGALDAWLAGLSEHEFNLRTHLVADLIVIGTRRVSDAMEIEIEVLTVEER